MCTCVRVLCICFSVAKRGTDGVLHPLPDGRTDGWTRHSVHRSSSTTQKGKFYFIIIIIIINFISFVYFFFQEALQHLQDFLLSNHWCLLSSVLSGTWTSEAGTLQLLQLLLRLLPTDFCRQPKLIVTSYTVHYVWRVGGAPRSSR